MTDFWGWVNFFPLSSDHQKMGPTWEMERVKKQHELKTKDNLTVSLKSCPFLGHARLAGVKYRKKKKNLQEIWQPFL